MSTWIELLGTGAASATAGAGASAFFGRRKIEAELKEADASVAKILTETATSLLEPLKEEIREQREEIKVQNKKIGQLTTRVEELEKENQCLRDYIDDELHKEQER